MLSTLKGFNPGSLLEPSIPAAYSCANRVYKRHDILLDCLCGSCLSRISCSQLRNF